MNPPADVAANAAIRFTDRNVQANLGHRHAFGYAEKRYTYTDVAALANRAGNLFKSLGLAPGGRVLVLLPGSPAWFASVIGAMKIGAVPILVPLADDAAALQACADAVKPALAVVHQDHLGKAAAALAALGAGRIVVVGQTPAGYVSFLEGMRAHASSLAAERVAPDAPALGLGGALVLTHRELGSMLDGENDRGLGKIALTLRALAKAEEAPLP